MKSVAHRKDHSRAITLLDQMPCLLEDIPDWFDSLSDSDFNQVCVSAITSYVADEQNEDRFVSVTSVMRLTQAMRDRYRRITGPICKPFNNNIQRGAAHPWSKLSNLQVRIIRRCEGLSLRQLAEIFGVEHTTILRIQRHENWRHIT